MACTLEKAPLAQTPLLSGVDVPLPETHGRPSWRHPLFESLFESLVLETGRHVASTSPLHVVVSLPISRHANKIYEQKA